MPKRRRSPQEKKKLSLQRDRRNTYGENDKSSRKNIPRSKALSHRSVRRAAKQQAQILDQQEELKADAVESTLTTRSLQKGYWKKAADEPLGTVIQKQFKARKFRDGRKHRRARGQIQPD